MYSWPPFGASERTIMAPNVLWAALGAPHTTLNQPFSPIIALSDVPFPTHFRQNGLLWHFSLKCVKLSIHDPAFQAPPGHIPPSALPRTSAQTAFCGTFRGSAYHRVSIVLYHRAAQNLLSTLHCLTNYLKRPRIMARIIIIALSISTLFPWFFFSKFSNIYSF